VDSLVEFTFNKDKGLGSTREPSSLRLVHRLCLTEEVVEVERPLVDQRVRLYRWALFELHDFRAGWSQRLVNPRAQGGRPVTGLFRPLVANQGLVLIAGEDDRWHQLLARHRFCQHVGHLVETP